MWCVSVLGRRTLLFVERRCESHIFGSEEVVLPIDDVGRKMCTGCIINVALLGREKRTTYSASAAMRSYSARANRSHSFPSNPPISLS